MSPSDLTCFGIYLYLAFIVLLLLLLSLNSLLKGNSKYLFIVGTTESLGYA